MGGHGSAPLRLALDDSSTALCHLQRVTEPRQGKASQKKFRRGPGAANRGRWLGQLTPHLALIFSGPTSLLLPFFPVFLEIAVTLHTTHHLPTPNPIPNRQNGLRSWYVLCDSFSPCRPGSGCPPLLRSRTRPLGECRSTALASHWHSRRGRGALSVSCLAMARPVSRIPCTLLRCRAREAAPRRPGLLRHFLGSQAGFRAGERTPVADCVAQRSAAQRSESQSLESHQATRPTGSTSSLTPSPPQVIPRRVPTSSRRAAPSATPSRPAAPT